MESAPVEFERSRHADSNRGLGADGRRDKQLATGGPRRLGRRECRGNHRDAYVCAGGGVRVVEVEEVAVHSVREGGARGGQPPFATDRRALWLATLFHGNAQSFSSEAKTARG